MITITKLIECGLRPTQARDFAGPLSAACTQFGIDTPQRAAGFIGQCMVESVGFTALEELLFYRDPARIATIFRSGFDLDGDRVVDPEEIAFARAYVGKPRELANRAYAGRNGNGAEASGDGWAYRGRGLIQLTGRSNYAAAAAACGKPYLEQPDLVAKPQGACLTAAWYFAAAGCCALADVMDWHGITRSVNGRAMLHKDERMAATRLALEVLG